MVVEIGMLIACFCLKPAAVTYTVAGTAVGATTTATVIGIAKAVSDASGRNANNSDETESVIQVPASIGTTATVRANAMSSPNNPIPEASSTTPHSIDNDPAVHCDKDGGPSIDAISDVTIITAISAITTSSTSLPTADSNSTASTRANSPHGSVPSLFTTITPSGATTTAAASISTHNTTANTTSSTPSNLADPNSEAVILRPTALQVVRSFYYVVKEIGHGSTGQVFQAIDRHTGRLLAVKVMPTIMNGYPAAFTRLTVLREAQALKELQHPNIVRLFTVFEDAQFAMLGMELCSRGSVEDMMGLATQGLDEFRALKIIADVLAAVGHMHSWGMSHRDIAPKNVVVAGDWTSKLCDFGLIHQRVRGKRWTSTLSCGSFGYVAPEVAVAGMEYHPPMADMWSCGALLYMMLVGKEIYPPEEGDRVANMTQREVTDLLEHKRLDRFSLPTNELLKGLLKVRPTERMSAQDAQGICEWAVTYQSFQRGENR